MALSQPTTEQLTQMSVDGVTVVLAVFVAYCGILVFKVICAYVFGYLSAYNVQVLDSSRTWHDLDDANDEWNYSSESDKFHQR